MTNTLFDLLPQLLRADPAAAALLAAFDHVLIARPSNGEVGSTQGPQQGLDEILADLPRYFSPGSNSDNGAPDEFLPWLSQWVALSLRTDIFQPGSPMTAAQAADLNQWAGDGKARFKQGDSLTQDVADDLNYRKRRKLISSVVPLYARRGTKPCMQELLKIYTGKEVVIDDQVDGKPHYFRVLLNLESLKGSDDRAAFDRAEELAHSVIRLEKPAHTYYLLVPRITTMRIGKSWPPDPTCTKYNIRVGRSTRLGFIPNR